MQLSPAREFLGMERYAIDCCGANLYVHDHAVVIDKTGGLWIVGDNNFKVIPFKSIAAIQVKLQSTIINGYCTCQQKLDTKLKKSGIKNESMYKIHQLF